MGSGIQNVFDNAFYNCSGLKDIYTYTTSPPQTKATSFDRAFIENVALHVPASAVNAYKAADPWKNFKEIVALTDSDPKPTGINVIEALDNDKGVIYNLNGRRVEQPTKGLFIKNGRKYVVK